jgi:hypothetical protein
LIDWLIDRLGDQLIPSIDRSRAAIDRPTDSPPPRHHHHHHQMAVGVGPGLTDPVVQDQLVAFTPEGMAISPEALAAEAADERARVAALLNGMTDDGENTVGTNSTHFRHQRRRLAPIMGQNFQGIPNTQGYVPPDVRQMTV